MGRLGRSYTRTVTVLRRTWPSIIETTDRGQATGGSYAPSLVIVSVERGGATANGYAPSDAGGAFDNADRGGATASATSVTDVNVSADRGSANAAGATPGELVTQTSLRGGATADASAPLIAATVLRGQATADGYLASPPGTIPVERGPASTGGYPPTAAASLDRGAANAAGNDFTASRLDPVDRASAGADGTAIVTISTLADRGSAIAGAKQTYPSGSTYPGSIYPGGGSSGTPVGLVTLSRGVASGTGRSTNQQKALVERAYAYARGRQVTDYIRAPLTRDFVVLLTDYSTLANLNASTTLVALTDYSTLANVTDDGTRYALLSDVSPYPD